MWLMKSSKSFEIIAIIKIWQLVFFLGVKTYFRIFASMNQYFIDKLDLFLTEVSFDTSEGDQLSYFQNGNFFKIL